MGFSARGQTAIEMLLIIACVVLFATIAIMMSNNLVTGIGQNISNVTIIPE